MKWPWQHEKPAKSEKPDHLQPLLDEMRARGLDPDDEKTNIPDDLWPWALKLEMRSRGIYR